jgi:SOS-response transcriptional repressor LexA
MSSKKLNIGSTDGIKDRVSFLFQRDGVADERRMKEVAGKLGVSQTAASKWRDGKSAPGADGIAALCKHFKVSLEWLLFGTGDPAPKPNDEPIDLGITVALGRRVPLISWVQAGAWKEVEDTFHPGQADEWVASNGKCGEHAFALRIVGDSMEPVFQPGDIIIVDPDVAAETGKYVIAKIKNEKGENGEATFKRFVRDGNNVYLRPLNTAYDVLDMTDKEFYIVGCVVARVTEII